MYAAWDYWGLYHKVTFDGVEKRIIVNPEVTTLDIRSEVYKAWVQWLGLGNTNFLFAMRYTGLDVIPGGFTGDSYFLTNGWRLIVDLTKIRINGILFSDNYATAYFDPDLNLVYPATVSSLVNTVTSTQNVVTGDLSSVTNLSFPTAAQNATAVWADATGSQVSVKVGSIATQSETALYRERVSIDSVKGGVGTVFPRGTHEFPVNNWANAISIATTRGFDSILAHGTITVASGVNLTGYKITGENIITTSLIVETGSNVSNCQFEDMIISNSVLSGKTYLRRVIVSGVSGIAGYMESCMLSGILTLSGTDHAYFIDCKSGSVGLNALDTPTLNLAGVGRRAAFSNFTGPINIINSTDATNTLCLDIASGATITLDATCTAGTVYVRGIANVVNNSAMTVITTAQLDKTSIGTAVWNHAMANLTAGSAGAKLNSSLTTSNFLALK